MSRRVKQQFLSALDMSKSTRELGQGVGDILGEYNLDATGKIDKDQRGLEYLMLQSNRRRVVIRRSSRKRVKPLSREEAAEVHRSGMKTQADNTSAWEAVPVGDNGKEGKPVTKREHIADLLVNWLLKLKNDELNEYGQETRMASQQDDFGGWGEQDPYGWEEEAPQPPQTARPAPRSAPPRRPPPRRRPAPAVEPPSRALAASDDPNQWETGREGRESLNLILKGVEVGQFSPKISQRIVAYALSSYLDFDKPKEWLDEEREKTLKEKVQQDVLSEIAAKINSQGGSTSLLSALAAGQGLPTSRKGRPQPSQRTVRRPRRPKRPAPSLSSMPSLHSPSAAPLEEEDEAPDSGEFGSFEDEWEDYEDDRFEDDIESSDPI